MSQARPLPTCRETGRTARGEFLRVAYPVFAGPDLPDDDRRVRLPDGRACYVWDDRTGTEPYPVLCTVLVGLDAGDGEVRRFAAGDRPSHGVAAPEYRGGPTLVAVPADGCVVGYYVEGLA